MHAVPWIYVWLTAVILLAFLCSIATGDARKPPGPLRVGDANPRYFADPAGNPVYLTGSHTWAVLHERAYPETPTFDYDAYLDFMQGHNHNFLRLWAWEHAAWMQFTDRKITYSPNRYLRTGPGKALDGKRKFDVTRFDEDYFWRLRSRVEKPSDRGIYVMVMMFQGFSIEQKGTEGVDQSIRNPWNGHPFNRENNINGIDGDLNHNGEGEELHTLAQPDIIRLQERYIKKVIDTLNDQDHVLWEISNESHGESTQWQYHMIDFIHDYEAHKPSQHPVVMTAQYPGGDNATLFASPADAISPNRGGGYERDPPQADGRKVILADTDHICALRGDQRWVWKTFCRGMNPIYMDSYLDARIGHTLNPKMDPARKAMGHTRSYANRMNLATAAPHSELASSRYCLATPGNQYLVYLPEGGNVTVDLSATEYTMAVEWCGPVSGETTSEAPVEGGARRQFIAPFQGDAVLYLNATRAG